MFLDELHKETMDTALSIADLKNDIQVYLETIVPDKSEHNKKKYYKQVREYKKYSKYLETCDLVIKALEENKPGLLLVNYSEINHFAEECLDGWPEYIDDFKYIRDIFVPCQNIEKFIKEMGLDIDSVDLSNPCAIADAIELVSHCLKDAVYISEVGDTEEYTDAIEDVETYKEILKFLMALV